MHYSAEADVSLNIFTALYLCKNNKRTRRVSINIIIIKSGACWECCSLYGVFAVVWLKRALRPKSSQISRLSVYADVPYAVGFGRN